MSTYGKTLLDIKAPKDRTPAHTNEFEVTLNWCLGDMDHMMSTVSYVPLTRHADIILVLNWLRDTNLGEEDCFSIEKTYPEMFKLHGDIFDYLPTESSSCMCYDHDGFDVVYYDHFGVARECIMTWSD